MTVETATYIGDLNPNYPAGGEPKAEGDNHMRLVKSALRASFPNLGSAPMTATAAQLNAVVSSAGVLSVGTSTTSVTIGTGSKSFTTQTGLGFAAGQSARIQDNANLANYMLGTISSYTSSTGALGFTSVSTYGSGTIADWSISIYAPNAQTQSISRRAVTGTDTVVAADWGGFIDCTSGTFTLSLTTVVTLGNGFWCFIRNSGTGDVTIDPDGSETIDGLTSFVMYPGEARLVQCNGSAFYSIVLSGFNKTFTASGTLTKPPGYQRFAGQLWGGGGGGRKDTNNSQFRHGGGGGACATFDFPASSFGTTETITIGSGGAAKTTTADGDDGGNSSIGSLVTAYGGEGGKTSASTTQGGSAYIANVPMATSGATPSSAYHAGCSQQGASTTVLGGGACGNAVYGNTVYGGAGGGTISSDDSTLYNPATYSTTVFGGAGGNASVASSGSDGTAPGGGGGATKSGAQSGAGARGELRIWGVV